MSSSLIASQATGVQSQAQAGPSTLPSVPSPSVPSTIPASDAAPSPISNEPHRMRIATQGKIRRYREFALKFLQENPSRPLVLHTLPPISISQPSAGSKDASKKPKRSATSQIPMLVSTVENVKRAYLELYAASLVPLKGKGRELEEPTPILGLWQYNETGCLEDIEAYRQAGLEVERDELREAERALERLKDVLGGKAGPKMIHTPYMIITLSTRPLPDLAALKHVTYQHIPLPAAPKRTKSKARARRRELQAGALAAEKAAEALQVVQGAPANVVPWKEQESSHLDKLDGRLTTLAQKVAGVQPPVKLGEGSRAAGKRKSEGGPSGRGGKKRKAGP